MNNERADLTSSLLAVLDCECSPELLELALVHRSFSYENGGIPTNERLEFLGDSVLGVVVTDYLYREFPDLPEGSLARMRASVVNAHALADVGRALGLGQYLLLGRGELSSGGNDKTSILADSLEAVIGAIYLSGGITAAGNFIHRIFDPMIIAASELGAGLDWKTSLQELCGVLNLALPVYHVTDSGPDHAKEFAAHAQIGDENLGFGAGTSKKAAEQIAAEQAYGELLSRHPDARTS
jgi:ribonuclease III